MDEVKREVGSDDAEISHRRGSYHCVNTGISLGGGSKVRLRRSARSRA